MRTSVNNTSGACVSSAARQSAAPVKLRTVSGVSRKARSSTQRMEASSSTIQTTLVMRVLLPLPGQHHAKHGMAGAAVVFDQPAVPHHDVLRHRQAQPRAAGAAADHGKEQTGLQRGGNAGAVVLDFGA